MIGGGWPFATAGQIQSGRAGGGDSAALKICRDSEPLCQPYTRVFLWTRRTTLADRRACRLSGRESRADERASHQYVFAGKIFQPSAWHESARVRKGTLWKRQPVHFLSLRHKGISRLVAVSHSSVQLARPLSISQPTSPPNLNSLSSTFML